jgi:hypothetical protein
VANLAGFSVATQAYSDLFVLLILSFTLGCLLAVAVLVERVRARRVRAREPATFEEVSLVLQPKAV